MPVEHIEDTDLDTYTVQYYIIHNGEKQLHNCNNPARVVYRLSMLSRDSEGNIIQPSCYDFRYTLLIEFYQNNKLHRDKDCPARIKNSHHTREYWWYKNGCNVTNLSGYSYYRHEADNRSIYTTVVNNVIHNNTSYAYVEYRRSMLYCKKWYNHGSIHNENGPAVIYYDELGICCRKEYWLYNQQYTYDEYIRKLADSIKHVFNNLYVNYEKNIIDIIMSYRHIK